VRKGRSEEMRQVAAGKSYDCCLVSADKERVK